MVSVRSRLKPEAPFPMSGMGLLFTIAGRPGGRVLSARKGQSIVRPAVCGLLLAHPYRSNPKKARISPVSSSGSSIAGK
jgi:hypothetical protein